MAKTPAREIRLFDSDEFLQHNAFRAPGAASLEELRDAPKKVDYLKDIYTKMHRGIVAHPFTRVRQFEAKNTRFSSLSLVFKRVSGRIFENACNGTFIVLYLNNSNC